MGKKTRTGRADKRGIFRGRLSADLPSEVREFASCLTDDLRLFAIDIDVVEAHNLMLAKIGAISREDLRKILKGLEATRREAERSSPEQVLKKLVSRNYYDIHPLVELGVIEKHGMEIGGKTHLGKSRNDQVMADIRIYLRRQTCALAEQLASLARETLSLAAKHRETVMPTYTHTQPAQAGTFGHYLLCQISATGRNIDRLLGAHDRINLNPLGASAIGGSSLALDRDYTSDLLGFEEVLSNSIDAVSGRDFMLEAASAFSMVMTDLSRWAADFILWSTPEFGMIEIPDAYADTSSAMPHKKNAFVLELIRGKTAGVLGNLNACFGDVAGRVTGYNQDFQELKHSLWQIVDAVLPSTRQMNGILPLLTVRPERMEEICALNFVTAIDIAEYLAIRAGIPFRQAHFIVGSLTRKLHDRGKTFADITAADLDELGQRAVGKPLGAHLESLRELADPGRSVRTRKSDGSPSPEAFDKLSHSLQVHLEQQRRHIVSLIARDRRAADRLRSEVRRAV